MNRLLRIAHLYPHDMNIYGDLGNVLTLRRRLEWRGYKVEVVPVEIGQTVAWDEIDIVFGGGGQDRGQAIVGPDLVERGPELRAVAEAGLPMLVICGLYQLFGRYFRTGGGNEIRGIGIFDATTTAGEVRLIGNVAVESPWGRLVGFENHSGVTELAPGQPALGQVLKGAGNTPQGKQEGAIIHNAVGTYLHGPLLPKNPALADWLIARALERRGITELAPLDDTLELRAAATADARPR